MIERLLSVISPFYFDGVSPNTFGVRSQAAFRCTFEIIPDDPRIRVKAKQLGLLR